MIPEGDFDAGGRHQTTDKVEANAQSQPFLNFTAITNRNHKINRLLTFLALLLKEALAKKSAWPENPC